MFFQFEKKRIRRFTAGLLSVLLVLAFIAGALPQTALAVQDATCAQNHTVVAGDTLSAISVKYDVSIQEIATANNLQEPYTLSVGQQLCIPGAAQTTSTTPTATSTTTSSTTGDDEETSSSKSPSMTLSVSSGLLTIQTSNFPTQGNFYLKAAAYEVRGTPNWYKMGLLRTKKEGSVIREVKLPKDLRKAELITVCVKNAATDDVLCRRVSTGVKQ